MSEANDMPEKVTIIVDGREVLATPGEMIIAAAERSGTYIPRFCYHPRMKPVGMCRMCLVEVKGPRGFSLQPACFIPAAEGQEVVTQSDKVKKAQDGVLEFLLANHPLDCPVCDKGGECPLQDQTLTFGPGESRFVEEKTHFEKPIPLSDLVLLDRERCILCDRCTRFASEVAGDPLIEFIDRGDQTQINTFPDDPFASYFSGNTVQICPVGALTASPYRFQARPWDLEQVESTCTSCSVGCRVAVQSTRTQLVRYLGIDSDPVNQGWMCDKGRFDFEAVNSEERITAPMMRKNDELVEVSWGEALDAAAEGLRKVMEVKGPTAVGVLGGARLADEDAYVWARVAKSVLQTDNVDCQLGDGLPAEAVLGLPRATIDDACRASAVILLAPDLKEELPVLFLRLRGAVVDGKTKVVELTSKRTGFSRYAAQSLVYRPGEAGAVVRGLLESENRDAGGVSSAQLAEARQLLSDDVVVILGRTSLSESAANIVDAAGVLASTLPNARFLSALRRANVVGALEAGLAPGILPGRVSLEEGRTWFSERWGALPAAEGMDAAAMLHSAANGPLDALVLLGADPESDFPDRDLARRALNSAEFVVAIDAFRTSSVEKADVVLPAAMYAERAGTTTNIEGRVSKLSQKVTPPGIAWPDWAIATELAARFSVELPYDSLESVWVDFEATAPSHALVTVAKLTANPDGVIPGQVDDQRVIDREDDPGIRGVEVQGPALRGFDEPARQDDLDPDRVHEAPPSPVRPPLMQFVRPEKQPAPPTLDAYSLRLISSRTLYDNGTLTQMSPSLAALVPRRGIHIHPADLERAGIRDGGQVRVRSSRSTILVDAVADRDVAKGTAWMPFNHAGEGAADLIDAMTPVTDIRLETP